MSYWDHLPRETRRKYQETMLGLREVLQQSPRRDISSDVSFVSRESLIDPLPDHRVVGGMGTVPTAGGGAGPGGGSGGGGGGAALSLDRQWGPLLMARTVETSAVEGAAEGLRAAPPMPPQSPQVPPTIPPPTVSTPPTSRAGPTATQQTPPLHPPPAVDDDVRAARNALREAQLEHAVAMANLKAAHAEEMRRLQDRVLEEQRAAIESSLQTQRLTHDSAKEHLKAQAEETRSRLKEAERQLGEQKKATLAVTKQFHEFQETVKLQKQGSERLKSQYLEQKSVADAHRADVKRLSEEKSELVAQLRDAQSKVAATAAEVEQLRTLLREERTRGNSESERMAAWIKEVQRTAEIHTQECTAACEEAKGKLTRYQELKAKHRRTKGDLSRLSDIAQQLQAKSDELEESVGRHAGIETELRREVAQLEQQLCDERTHHRSTLDDFHERALRQKQDLEQQLSASRGEVMRLDAALAESQNKILISNEQLEVAEAEKEKLKEQLQTSEQALRDAIQHRRDDDVAHRRELADTAARHRAALDQLQIVVRDREAKIESLVASGGNSMHEVHRLRDSIAHERGRAAYFEQQLETQKSKVAQLERSCEELRVMLRQSSIALRREAETRSGSTSRHSGHQDASPYIPQTPPCDVGGGEGENVTPHAEAVAKPPPAPPSPPPPMHGGDDAVAALHRSSATLLRTLTDDREFVAKCRALVRSIPSARAAREGSRREGSESDSSS